MSRCCFCDIRQCRQVELLRLASCFVNRANGSAHKNFSRRPFQERERVANDFLFCAQRCQLSQSLDRLKFLVSHVHLKTVYGHHESPTESDKGH